MIPSLTQATWKELCRSPYDRTHDAMSILSRGFRRQNVLFLQQLKVAFRKIRHERALGDVFRSRFKWVCRTRSCPRDFPFLVVIFDFPVLSVQPLIGCLDKTSTKDLLFCVNAGGVHDDIVFVFHVLTQLTQSIERLRCLIFILQSSAQSTLKSWSSLLGTFRESHYRPCDGLKHRVKVIHWIWDS